MKKTLILLTLLAGCQTVKTIPMLATPRRIVVTYSDHVSDTLTTTYEYQLGPVVYINECSCDGTVAILKP